MTYTQLVKEDKGSLVTRSTSGAPSDNLNICAHTTALIAQFLGDPLLNGVTLKQRSTRFMCAM